MPSSGLGGHCIHMVQLHTYTQTIIHIKTHLTKVERKQTRNLKIICIQYTTESYYINLLFYLIYKSIIPSLEIDRWMDR